MSGVQACRDYERIERAIRFLERNVREQPKLGDVARHLGLSESHVQRLFRRWAGTSPKRFLHVLTTEHAKTLLEDAGSVLEVTHEAGLSSTSRPHHLSVHCEAVTPGESGCSGEGMEVFYGSHPSPFGECVIAATGRGVCGLRFVRDGREAALQALQACHERAEWHEDRDRTRPLAGRIFTPRSGDDARPLQLWLEGTNFQVRVWQALLRIPPGALVAYKDVAEHLGKPKASRAVANAVGRNPVPYLVPCHRVIRSTGAFGGYGGGTARKKALHAWEVGT